MLKDILIELQPKLFQMLLGRTKDYHLAEDLLGQFNLNVLSGKHQPKNNDNLHGFLMTCCNNFFLDHCRNPRTKAGITKPNNSEVDFTELQAVDSNYFEMDTNQLMKLISSPLGKKVVAERLDTGDKFKNIAKRLQVPHSTARWAYRQAIEEIKGKLGIG